MFYFKKILYFAKFVFKKQFSFDELREQMKEKKQRLQKRTLMIF